MSPLRCQPHSPTLHAPLPRIRTLFPAAATFAFTALLSLAVAGNVLLWRADRASRLALAAESKPETVSKELYDAAISQVTELKTATEALKATNKTLSGKLGSC